MVMRSQRHRDQLHLPQTWRNPAASGHMALVWPVCLCVEQPVLWTSACPVWKVAILLSAYIVCHSLYLFIKDSLRYFFMCYCVYLCTCSVAVLGSLLLFRICISEKRNFSWVFCCFFFLIFFPWPSLILSLLFSSKESFCVNHSTSIQSILEPAWYWGLDTQLTFFEVNVRMSEVVEHWGCQSDVN